MPEERPFRRPDRQRAPKRPPGKKPGGFGLIIMQSIAAAVLVLVIWLFSLAGGNAFSGMKESFRKIMMDNSVMQTIGAWIDKSGKAPAQSQPVSEDNGVREVKPDVSEPKDTSETPSTKEKADTQTPSSSQTKAAQGAVTSDKAVDAEAKQTSQGGRAAPSGASFAKLTVNRAAKLPVKSGTFTSGFGYRKNPTGDGIEFHTGVDIAGTEGEDIYAMFFGVVSETGNDKYLGNYIKIYHGNGIQVLYAHCLKLVAQKNSVVRAGEVVAKMGSTGNSTGPHVHIEVIKEGISYNPSSIVPLSAYD